MPPNRPLLLVISALAVALCLLGAFGAVGVAEPANETTEHENPDLAEESGDEGAVSEWLRGQLDESLGESSVLLNQRQYDAARDAIGDDYDDHLRRYAEVEGADADEERRTVDDFEEARDNQRNLTDDVESYDRTYEEYQQAVEDGDDDRARELARELDGLAGSIEERSEQVDEAYQRSEDETGRDTTAERESVEDVRSEIERRHSEVQEREFLETELNVTGEPTEISFVDPMSISGTVTTEEGDPVADEPITLAIEDQSTNTTTDETGSFTATYRPTVLPLNATTIDVEYVPERGSPYAGSNASVPVAVEQVDSDVEVTEHTENASFGDDLTANGSVSANDTGADSVPVALAIGGEEYDRTETDQDGTFSLNASVPVDVPAGEAEVQVLTDLENQALSSSETTVPVDVEETQAAMEVRVEPTGESGAIIAGELMTVDGDPLSNQTIEIDVDGERLTVETGDEGTFERTVTLDEDAASVTITVSYADPGTNIEDIEESVTLELQEEGGGGGIDGLLAGYGVPVSADVLSLLTLAVAIGFVLLVGIVRRDWFRGGGAVSSSGELLRRGETEDTNARVIGVLLSAARERLQAGETDRAITLAYTAVRLALGRGPTEAQTHWEFFQECLAEEFTDEEIHRLESLTSNFEVAAFAPYATSESTATQSVDDAQRIAE